jgi:hypothetical protein
VSTWAVLYWLLIVAVMLMACVFIPPGWPEAARVRRLPRAAWEGARDTVAITVIAVMALWQGPSPAHPARKAAARAADNAAFEEITRSAELLDLAARYEAIARAYVDLGPPGWDDIRRMIPEQATDYEGDHQ